MTYSINTQPLWLTLLIIGTILPLLFCQALWLFKDAQKRGRNPWFWGIWGLLHFPDPLLVYYLLVIRKDNKKEALRANGGNL